MPAIVNAGVVVAVATDTIPPVQPTLVTVPIVASVDQLGTPPDTIRCCPVVPTASLAKVLTPLAYTMSPAAYDVCPVPPWS